MASSFLERGGALVLVQFALMLAVIVLGVVFPGDWMRSPMIVAGLGLLTAGGWFGIAGVRVLGRNRTPFPQPRDDSELVQQGIMPECGIRSTPASCSRRSGGR